ncbi:MAG: carboxymuconolactone decarboxylase family protein [Thaumarchaeota archaeon]|nr:MAG: carboxymuconolactone decarboxylase family protein [Nitrososphaerota archaeon]
MTALPPCGTGMKSAEIVRYFEKNLGWVPDFADILSRYKPDTLESYFAMRSSVMKDTPQGGALPLKFKEILYVVLDSITNNTEGAIAHARAAIKAGAKTEELAEALIIMAMLTGMPRLEVVGTKAFRAAEEEEKKKKKKKK